MTSEVRVVERRPGGSQRVVWRKRSDARPNHLWDAAVYGEALTDALSAGDRRPALAKTEAQSAKENDPYGRAEEGYDAYAEA